MDLDDILSRLKLNQLLRYAFGGGLLIFFAYICRPDIVGEMIKSMGVIFAPLFILGLGVAIYVFERNVLGELFWYPIIHIVHYVLDRIHKRRDKENCTSPMIYLNELGIKGIKKYFIRRDAYTAIRRLFNFDNSSELRKKFDIAHAERHVLWITTNIFILFYFYIYRLNPSDPEIFSSIFKPSIIIFSYDISCFMPYIICGILIIGSITADILQLRYECHIIRKFNRYGQIERFLKDYKFINVKKEKNDLPH